MYKRPLEYIQSQNWRPFSHPSQTWNQKVTMLNGFYVKQRPKMLQTGNSIFFFFLTTEHSSNAIKWEEKDVHCDAFANRSLCVWNLNGARVPTACDCEETETSKIAEKSYYESIKIQWQVWIKVYTHGEYTMIRELERLRGKTTTEGSKFHLLNLGF